MKRWIDLLILTGMALIIVFLANGCASQPTAAGLKLGDASAMPVEMQQAPQRVREAYQFAMTHPEALENVPCYCGCGNMGHHSNYACYIKDRNADGSFVFDEHALGCSICVDIAQDVMRLTREGKQAADIRTFIVNTYSRFGPSNQ